MWTDPANVFMYRYRIRLAPVLKSVFFFLIISHVASLIYILVASLLMMALFEPYD